MVNKLLLLLIFELVNSAPSCVKGINNCSICNPISKLCVQCDYDVLVPDENGGCKKAETCTSGKNFCLECNAESNSCKTCNEGYYPDDNGGCSYTDNCEISYKGKCLRCKENYILSQSIGICKSLDSDEFKNCEKIQNSDATCEKCIEGYYLSSEDKSCSKTENCKETIFEKCVKCNAGFYLDKKEEKCKEQSNNLLHCKEVMDGGKCYQCEDDYYFDQEGICVSTNFCEKGNAGVCQKCLPGYFPSKSFNVCIKTENCSTGLKKLGICTQCVSGYYLDYKDGKCKSNQEENKFKNCAFADNECIECSLMYYLGEDHKCTKTIHCAESIDDVCIECQENYYLGLDNRCSNVEHCIYSSYECLECENLYYYEKKTKTCKNWDELFEGCKYGYEDKGCERCHDDYYLNKTDKLCYDNHLNDSFYKCATTDDEGLNCKSCVGNYTLVNKYKTCTNIKGCYIQQNDDKCLECNSYNYLDLKTGLCQNNNIVSNKKFYKCKKSNEEGTACGECLEGYSLLEGICVLDE